MAIALPEAGCQEAVLIDSLRPWPHLECWSCLWSPPLSSYSYEVESLVKTFTCTASTALESLGSIHRSCPHPRLSFKAPLQPPIFYNLASLSTKIPSVFLDSYFLQIKTYPLGERREVPETQKVQKDTRLLRPFPKVTDTA